MIIYIYNDEGVSATCLESCKVSISSLSEKHQYRLIDAAQTINGVWREDATVFIIPGGADLPYCKKLNTLGNIQIKEFVENGGLYIGFCAGAYYASSFCEFHAGDLRGYEVLESRELCFFPGRAVGPVLASYDYESESGSRIAKIKWMQTGEIFNTYFNGGCYFQDAIKYSAVQILATYCNQGFEGLAAIVECKIGKGKAVLSGAHPECSAEVLESALRNQAQSTASIEDYQHFTDNIRPGLSDHMHMTLFSRIINWD